MPDLEEEDIGGLHDRVEHLAGRQLVVLAAPHDLHSGGRNGAAGHVGWAGGLAKQTRAAWRAPGHGWPQPWTPPPCAARSRGHAPPTPAPQRPPSGPAPALAHLRAAQHALQVVLARNVHHQRPVLVWPLVDLLCGARGEGRWRGVGGQGSQRVALPYRTPLSPCKQVPIHSHPHPPTHAHPPPTPHPPEQDRNSTRSMFMPTAFQISTRYRPTTCATGGVWERRRRRPRRTGARRGVRRIATALQALHSHPAPASATPPDPQPPPGSSLGLLPSCCSSAQTSRPPCRQEHAGDVCV